MNSLLSSLIAIVHRKLFLVLFLAFPLAAHAQIAGYARVDGQDFESYALSTSTACGNVPYVKNLTCVSPEGTGQYSVRASSSHGGTSTPGRAVAYNFPASGTVPLLIFEETFTVKPNVKTQIDLWWYERVGTGNLNDKMTDVSYAVLDGGTASSTTLVSSTQWNPGPVKSQTWTNHGSPVFTPTQTTITLRIYADVLQDGGLDPLLDDIAVYQALPTLVLNKIKDTGDSTAVTATFSGQTNLSATPGSVTSSTVDATSGSNNSSVYAVATGSPVTFTESAITGLYLKSVSCTDGNTLGSGNTNPIAATLSGNTVTIPQGAIKLGAQFTCSLTNVKPKLTVTKSLLTAGDAGQFQMTANGVTGAAAGNGATVTARVNAGATAVAFSEAAATGSPALVNYSSTIACVRTGTSTMVAFTAGANNQSGTVTTMPNADVTCTIGNTRKSATLKVAKVWGANSAGTSTTVSTTGFINNSASSGLSTAPNNTVGTTTQTVYAGETGKITETTLNGYVPTYKCETAPGTPAATTVDAAGNVTVSPTDNGLTVTCTITNTPKTATLRIQKTFLGGGPQFTINVSGAASGTCTINPTGNTGTLSCPSTYTVTPNSDVTIEEPVSGFPNQFTLYDMTCVDGSGAPTGSTLVTSPTKTVYTSRIGGKITGQLVPGADVTCTFTNTKNVTGTIRKIAIGGNGTFNYNVYIGSSTPTGTPASTPALTTTGGTATFSQSFPSSGTGNFAVQEVSQSGWVLTDATCTQTNAVGSLSNLQTNLTYTGGGYISGTVAAGAEVLCDFTNVRVPTITIAKQTVRGTGSFSFSGGDNGLPATLTLNTATANPATTSAYTVTNINNPVNLTETVPAGWALQKWECASSSGTVVASGTTAAMNIPSAVLKQGNDLTCTFTNTSTTKTLKLSKTFAANSIVGDTTTVSGLGASSPATTVPASGTITGSAGTGVTVNFGQTGALSETFSVGSAADYTKTYSCTAGASVDSNGNVTIDSTASDPTCTITNTLTLPPGTTGPGLQALTCPTGSQLYKLGVSEADTQTTAKLTWTAGSLGPQTYTFGGTGAAGTGISVTLSFTQNYPFNTGYPALFQLSSTGQSLVDWHVGGSTSGQTLSILNLTTNVATTGLRMLVEDVDSEDSATERYREQVNIGQSGNWLYPATGYTLSGNQLWRTSHNAPCNTGSSACNVQADWSPAAGGSVAAGTFTVAYVDKHATADQTGQGVGFDNIHLCVVNPTLQVEKTVINDNGGTKVIADFGIASDAGTLTPYTSTTNAATSTTVYTSAKLAVVPKTYTLSESAVPNYTATTWSCTGNSTAMPKNAAGDASVTVRAGETVLCKITNDDSNQANLYITKSNTYTAANPSDQASDTLASGDFTTYTIVVTNGGPAKADGAKVIDTPGTGLSNCTVTGTSVANNAVAPTTPGDILTTGGAIIPTLPSGGKVTFTVQCKVN